MYSFGTNKVELFHNFLNICISLLPLSTFYCYLYMFLLEAFCFILFKILNFVIYLELCVFILFFKFYLQYIFGSEALHFFSLFLLDLIFSFKAQKCFPLGHTNTHLLLLPSLLFY